MLRSATDLVMYDVTISYQNSNSAAAFATVTTITSAELASTARARAAAFEHHLMSLWPNGVDSRIRLPDAQALR